MTAQAYGAIIAVARTGSASFSEDAFRTILTPMVWPNGAGYREGAYPAGEWLDRDEAFTSLSDLPLTIANMVSGDQIEKVIDPSYSGQTEAFVMYVRGINRYDFDTARAEEAAGKVFNPTNPDWLRGAPKIVFAILKAAGLEPTLTTDPAGDLGGLGGTRLVVPGSVT